MFRTFRERGFTLVTALFLLVVLALLGLFIVSVFGLQQSSQALDVSGTRTYAGAQAGIEWALVQVLDPDNNDPLLVPANPQPPNCFSPNPQSVALGSAFSGIAVSVACSVTTTTELNRNVAVYLLTATATTGTGTAFPISRQVTATVSRCTDPTGTAPRYSCP
jgi:MSHA biogenesis protein MshP